MQQISPPQRELRLPRIIGAIVLIVGAILALVMLFQPASGTPGAVTGGPNILALAPVAFIAGVLSFLSPCTLPILPAYFAFTFGSAGSGEQGRGRVVLSSVAFFGGLATTLVITGASVTIIGQLISGNRAWLAQLGGTIIIIFGLMSIAGKGFSGPQIKRRRGASLAGAYLYGLTFALGWSACIGPILGTILTMLLAEGGSLVAGALLSFIYALGIALPLILVATFFGQLGQGSRFWRVLRGKAWEINVGGRSILLHSTNVISGLLLILVGVLLLTGQLDYFTRYGTTDLARWGLEMEQRISAWFGL